MNVEEFVKKLNADFYTGVPDSLLSPLGNYLMEHYGISERHIIGANEGNCVGMAAGHYLATGNIPVVYMQNSGIGNSINPIASLLSKEVYGIPCIFVIGWRGKAGIKDEPQHIFQGRITQQLLDDLQVRNYIITNTTTSNEFDEMIEDGKEYLANGSCIAYIIDKGALEYQSQMQYANGYTINRENAIENIVKASMEDIIVATTGKISRELFEVRERMKALHCRDFLTVGSMGHSSSIALKIALENKNKTIWCIDGDGAVLMHMGALSVIGNLRPANMIHVVLNNEAHESVGGMPTALRGTDLAAVAKACGYECVHVVTSEEEIEKVLYQAKANGMLTLIEIKVALDSRKDLGRPTALPKENKERFMKYVIEELES